MPILVSVLDLVSQGAKMLLTTEKPRKGLGWEKVALSKTWFTLRRWA